MATIESGADNTVKLTVDPTSKAARTTIYDSSGNEISKPPSGSYMAPIAVRQTAATAANQTVWAMRNGATKTVLIRRLHFLHSFDGTAAAAADVGYFMERFSAATPSGGTTVGVAKKRTSDPNSTVADIRFLDTGLTTTSVVFDNEMMRFVLPASATGVEAVHDIDFSTGLSFFDNIELAANEGFCIRLSAAAIIGEGIFGTIFWDER